MRHARSLLRGSPLLLAATLALSACGDATSPEQQVREVVHRMEMAAEARDVGDLMRHVSKDYRDAYGRSAGEAARYARGYFIANQSIHLLTRVESIDFPGAQEAHAKVLVGMVGRDADAAGTWGVAADVYQFEIALLREGDEWRVSYAQWERR